MNCRTARSLFSLHLDRYLSYEEERNLMQHLGQCTTCAAEYKGVEQTVRWVRDLPGMPASETFLQDVIVAAREARRVAGNPPAPRLRGRLREVFAWPSWFGSPLVAPAALALGLAVGLGGTMLVSHGPAEGPSAVQVVATSGDLAAEDDEVIEAPPPSGPFEDLVQEMLRRAELEKTGPEEGEVLDEDLKWGPPVDAEVQGRQVGTSTESWRDRDAGRRVTVAF